MSQVTDQAFASALQHLQAGRLPEAEALLRGVLARDPDRADALEALAGLRYRAGDVIGAEGLFRRAVAAAPRSAGLHACLGAAMAAQGKLDAAAESLRTALALDPENAQFLVHLGAVLGRQGQFESAINSYRQAIIRQPHFPEAYNNLGNVLARVGRHEEAAAALQQAVEQKPGFVEAHSNLSAALRESRHLAEAIAAAGAAIRLRADFAEAHFNLGVAQTLMNRHAEAQEALQQAIVLRPRYAEAHFALATVLERLSEPEAALAAYRTCVELDGTHTQARVESGTLLLQLGRLEEAIAAHRRTVELYPDCAGARLGLGMGLLLQGKFAEGWPLFEARREIECFGAQNPALPRWSGEALDGRRILLHAEQGLGDVIHFCRYAALVSERGGRVVLQAYEKMRRLLTGQPGIEQFVAGGDPVPPCDLECPLLSLAKVMGTALHTIPGNTPYLFADSALMSDWTRRIAFADGRLRVGLVWAGNPTHRFDRLRSVELAQLAPLASIEGVVFFSLQVGPRAGEARNAPAGMEMHDYSDELGDLADTAALVASLDLVIAVDTAVAHLAAALGKPVWLLLQQVPDWRWMLDRSDSPWYPSMRLFRQHTYGDWEGVIEDIRAELVNRARKSTNMNADERSGAGLEP